MTCLDESCKLLHTHAGECDLPDFVLIADTLRLARGEFTNVPAAHYALLDLLARRMCTALKLRDFGLDLVFLRRCGVAT
jgi:hypothetical protein